MLLPFSPWTRSANTAGCRSGTAVNNRMRGLPNGGGAVMAGVMKTCFQLWCVLLASFVALPINAADKTDALRKALTFHASFDNGTEADFAVGEKKLRHAPSMSKRGEAKPGLPESGEVVIAKGEGKYGNGLRFVKKKSP